MIFIFYYWVNYEFLWKIQEKKALISSKKAPSWKGFIQHISITVIFIKTSSIKCTKQHVRITVASKYQVDVTEKKTHIPTYKHSSKPYIIYLFMFNFGNIKIKKREKKEEGRKKQGRRGENLCVYILQKNKKKRQETFSFRWCFSVVFTCETNSYCNEEVRKCAIEVEIKDNEKNFYCCGVERIKTLCLIDSLLLFF